MTETAGPLCSDANRSFGLDPIGNASPFDRFFLVELPLPWPKSLLDHTAGVALYQRLRGVFDEAMTAGFPARISGLVPDAEWSRPDVTRVITYRRPDAPFMATYERDEHLFTDPEDIQAFARAFFFDRRDEMAAFDSARVPGSDQGGDLLVCTHGAYDACCGTKGMPVYQAARATLPETRTWRVMHSGGHRYAPTALVLPTGQQWGFLDVPTLTRIVRREGEVGALVRHLRGWAASSSPWEQAAERTGFEHHGWAWLDMPRSTALVEVSDGHARVRVEYVRDATPAAFEAEVAIVRTVDLDACGPSGEDKVSRYAEYAVRALRPVHPAHA
jgi:hypothetical protein